MIEHDPTPRPWSALARGLGENTNKFQKALTTAALVNALYRQGKQFAQAQIDKRQYEITVTAGNELFEPVQEWLMGVLPHKELRSVEAIPGRWNRDGRRASRKLLIGFDDSVDQKLTIDGYPVRVQVYREQPTFDFNTGSHDSPTGVPVGPAKKSIRILCPSAEARDGILKFMSELLTKHDRGVDGSRCFTIGAWGDWNRQDFLVQRPLHTVYLPEGVIEDVVSDVQLFLDTEKQYLELGLPYHRGYMFSGPPGTGKTSLARALASYFSLDIYAIALPDLKKDQDLNSALVRMEAPAILLIEDIDVATAASSREEHDNTVSLSGLLNALDGVGTPHGLITIMTSNHPEKLDDALLRTGRVDYNLTCAPLQGEELKVMIQGILDLPVAHEFRDGIIPSDVMEVIKRNLHLQPEMVVRELVSEFGA